MAVLVDSNVLLDVFTEDADWFAWSAAAADRARLVINPIVFAEVSVHFDTIEELEQTAPPVIEREDIPYEAAFLAGKCFLTYRRRGGVRASPLPDFFIGAHAATRGHELLTRDAARFRAYFPNLARIVPQTPS